MQRRRSWRSRNGSKNGQNYSLNAFMNRRDLTISCIFADRHLVLVLLDLAQQCTNSPFFRNRQLTESLLRLWSPLSRPTAMTSFVQPGQTKFAPPLSLLLDTVQMRAECISSPLQGQALAQAQNSLDSHPRPRMRTRTPISRSVCLCLVNSKCFMAQPLMHCQ